MKTIGVLALQGDYAKHVEMVSAAGALGREVREAGDLEKIDGLIIPGGESTTIGKLLVRFGMLEPIRIFAASGGPVFGTCAGTILLAKNIEGSDQVRLGLLDIEVRRNAYGRQIESFEADIPVPMLGEIPLLGVFIRAPIISKIDGRVDVLAVFDGTPVFVRQGNIISTTFHPELTGDPRAHKYFLSLVEGE